MQFARTDVDIVIAATPMSSPLSDEGVRPSLPIMTEYQCGIVWNMIYECPFSFEIVFFEVH